MHPVRVLGVTLRPISADCNREDLGDLYLPSGSRLTAHQEVSCMATKVIMNTKISAFMAESVGIERIATLGS